MANQPKRLIVCLDGTWNSPDNGHATNVVRTMTATCGGTRPANLKAAIGRLPVTDERRQGPLPAPAPTLVRSRAAMAPSGAVFEQV